jgi:hypothetical protein
MRFLSCFIARHALLLDESTNPIPRHWRRQAARFPVHCHDGGRRKFRPVSTLIPRHFRPVTGHIPNVFLPIPIMIPFHSVEASQAVTEIAPPRPERFRELSAAKDFIAELHKKRASFRSIADLLTRHSLPISKSAVAEFCHEVLGEISRPNKRRPRKRPPASNLSENEPLSTITTPSFLPTTGNARRRAADGSAPRTSA